MKIIVILICKAFACCVKFGDDWIVPDCSCVHWDASINSKGVTRQAFYAKCVAGGGETVNETVGQPSITVLVDVPCFLIDL